MGHMVTGDKIILMEKSRTYAPAICKRQAVPIYPDSLRITYEAIDTIVEGRRRYIGHCPIRVVFLFEAFSTLNFLKNICKIKLLPIGM